MTNAPAFHLAFPIKDIEETRSFYAGVLDCQVGRECDTWIDFDFFGHQISAHVSTQADQAIGTNAVDGDAVPVRHFGVILEWDDWQALADRITRAGIPFIIEPHVRFRGEAGEQATMFFMDPSRNALEFKSFRDMSRVFARSDSR